MGNPLPTLFSESTPALQIRLKIPPLENSLCVGCSILEGYLLNAGVVGVRHVLIALAILGQGTPVLGLRGDEGTVEYVGQACK